MRAFDSSGASTARTGRSPPAVPGRGRSPGRAAWRALALPADAATTVLTADDAHRRPAADAVTLPFPHRAQPLSGLPATSAASTGPACSTVFFVSTGDRPDGAAGCSTGVVSTSNRSLGVQSRAVHNAISVDSLIWLGSLVNSADTDADDNSRPARSASSRRSSVPVHTSRCAAAIRSRHRIFMPTGPPRSARRASRSPRGDRRPR